MRVVVQQYLKNSMLATPASEQPIFFKSINYTVIESFLWSYFFLTKFPALASPSLWQTVVANCDFPSGSCGTARLGFPCCLALQMAFTLVFLATQIHSPHLFFTRLFFFWQSKSMFGLRSSHHCKINGAILEYCISTCSSGFSVCFFKVWLKSKCSKDSGSQVGTIPKPVKQTFLCACSRFTANSFNTSARLKCSKYHVAGFKKQGAGGVEETPRTLKAILRCGFWELFCHLIGLGLPLPAQQKEVVGILSRWYHFRLQRGEPVSDVFPM